jgi:hypothetical protein
MNTQSRISFPKRLICLASSSLLFVYILLGYGFSQIQNGGFEAPAAFAPNWLVVGGPVVGGPGAGGSANSAQLGPSAGKILPAAGWVGTKIQQEFLCGVADPTRKCYVKFDYRLAFAGGGAKGDAVIVIRGPAGQRMYFLAQQAAFVTRQVEYPVCDTLTIMAMITQDRLLGITHTFRIDNFADKCDTLPFPGIPVIPPDTICIPPSLDCDAINFLVSTPPTQNNVPTLSQWGMLILGLLILCLGGVYIFRRNRVVAKSKEV